MTPSQMYRASGLSVVIGAVAFIVHIVVRSLLTAGMDPLTAATHGLWVPISMLGFVGAMLVLLGLPGVYARMAVPIGLVGLVGVILIVVAWTFFGIFLSLYAALLQPSLAQQAPALIAGAAPPPAEFMIAFVSALVTWLAGAILLAIPFIRGRVRPGWVGYLLPVSALWTAVGSLVIAPGGPASNLGINLLSNLGPVLLLVALGDLGARIQAHSSSQVLITSNSSS